MFSYIVFFIIFCHFLLIYMKITRQRLLLYCIVAVVFNLAGDGEGGGGPFWDYLGTILEQVWNILDSFWDHFGFNLEPVNILIGKLY